MLVRVRGALALTEAAERAPHRADVRDVDVAVHHERHRLPRQLFAQLVRRRADLLDGLRARLREQRRQLTLAQPLTRASLLDRAAHQVRVDRALLPADRTRGVSRSSPRDERPVLRLDRVQHSPRDPLGVDVLRVHAQALGKREAVPLQASAHAVRGGEGVLRRDVIPVRREPSEVGCPGGHELRPPVREVRGDLDAHVRHQPPRLRDQALHVLDLHWTRARLCPIGQRQSRMQGRAGRVAVEVIRAQARRALIRVGGAPVGVGGAPIHPIRPRGLLRDHGRLLAVVALVGHEVLQDHLLDVPILGVYRRDRLKRRHPLLLALADPHQDPRGERDLELPRRADRLQAPLRVLGRRARVHRLHQPLGDRLQHQPLRGCDLT